VQGVRRTRSHDRECVPVNPPLDDAPIYQFQENQSAPLVASGSGCAYVNVIVRAPARCRGVDPANRWPPKATRGPASCRPASLIASRCPDLGAPMPRRARLRAEVGQQDPRPWAWTGHIESGAGGIVQDTTFFCLMFVGRAGSRQRGPSNILGEGHAPCELLTSGYRMGRKHARKTSQGMFRMKEYGAEEIWLWRGTCPGRDSTVRPCSTLR